MSREEIRDEVSKYVQALETNYNDTIRDLKQNIEREKHKVRRVQSERVN